MVRAMAISSIARVAASFCISSLFFILTCSSFAMAQSSVRFEVLGPPVSVYDWQAQHCSTSDVPDAAARAFRDASGKVHLFASSSEARQFVGSSLSNVEHSCSISYQADHSASPAAFDDEGWLESFFTANGRDVIALVSMDYHPGRHMLRCGDKNSDAGSCWYSAITLAISIDGGYSFSNELKSKRVVVAPDRKFDPIQTKPEGAFVPSNIVRSGQYLYFLASVSRTGSGHGGECLYRSAAAEGGERWDAWDGSKFSSISEDPYHQQSQGSPKALCAPVEGLSVLPVRTLLRLRNSAYLAVGVGQVTPGAKKTIVAQTSNDLFHWQAPVEVADLPIYQANEGAPGEKAYYYPSLLDPNSKSLSFDTVDGDNLYLFLTQVTYGQGMHRNLVRVPVKIILEPGH